MDLLRFTTAGSVDDGKSTLIGRLLYDSQAVYEDQLHSVRKATRNQATKGLDLSLLTDGLRAEREQGITIDVAYRYFSTPRRKFIIADTPGHEQYTRNMATGASTADLAVILIDARQGVLPQSRRHAYIARLLGIPHLVAAVNKMDLVDFRQDVFDAIRAEFSAFLDGIEFGGRGPAEFIPISALDGDNVVRRSQRAGWYDGPSLLEHLEAVPVADGRAAGPFRFPVQYVIRPDLHFRGFAGQIAAGSVRKSEEVRIFPSGETAHVKSIVTFNGELEEASAPMSVTLQLDREIDVSRGDVIAEATAAPNVGRGFEASLVWMSSRPLAPGRSYLLKHGAQTTPARIARILHKVDITSLAPRPAAELGLNDIASVRIEAQRPLSFDAYDRIRLTGAFILIDSVTNETAAAGMIRCPFVTESRGNVTAEERQARLGHAAFVVAIESSEEAVARKLERMLFDRGLNVYVTEKNQTSLEAVKGLMDAGFSTVIYGNHMDNSWNELMQKAEYAFQLNQRDTSIENLAKWAEKIVNMLL